MLCIDLLLLFLCLSSSLSATSTTKHIERTQEPLLASSPSERLVAENKVAFSTKPALVPQSSLTLSPRSINHNGNPGRTLFQEGGNVEQGSDFECSLSPRDIRRYLDERTWRITDAVLDEIEQDVQSIINCSEEGDVLLFDVSKTIRPANRMTIPWTLTLRGNVENGLSAHDALVESATGARFECPREDEGILTIRANHVQLENLAFQNCVFTERYRSKSIIEGPIECNDGANGTLTLIHVQFKDNQLLGAVGLRMRTSLSCMALKMTNVQFEGNTCFGSTCGAVLSSDNALEKCTFLRNHLDDAEDDSPFMLSAPTETTITAREIKAEENAVGLLKIESGRLSISESTFSGNRPMENGPFGPFIHLNHTTAAFEACFFEANGGSGAGSLMMAEQQSDVTFADCHFYGNTANSGGVLYLTHSNVEIGMESTFELNNAWGNDGGVVHAFESRVSVSNAIFKSNEAVHAGGCFYLESNSFLNISSGSSMESNVAVRGGVATVIDSTANLADAVFENSQASKSNGGALDVYRSLISVRNCQFTEGDAVRGGFVYAEDAVLELSASSFSSGHANHGGAVALVKGSVMHMWDVRMNANEAALKGGAIYMIGGASVDVNHSRCISNTAKGKEDREGGGGCIFSESSSLTLLHSVLSKNEAENASGGAVACGKDSMLSENASVFSENKAMFGGAISLYSESRANISHTDIFDSRAGDSGGALFIFGSRVELSYGNISQSSAKESGGLLYASSSTVGILLSWLKYGSAADGGCLHLVDGTKASIRDTSLTACEAGRNGGALSITDDAECNITRDFLEENMAKEMGGAIYATGRRLMIQDTHIAKNKASEGGGIYASDGTELNLRSSNLTENTATDGGALAITTTTTRTEGMVTNIFFSQNKAGDRGGACYLFYALANFTDCDFQGNSGKRGGSLGVWSQSEANLTDSICRDSFASDHGGCLFGSKQSRIDIRNVTLKNCTALQSGGGIRLKHSTHLHLTNDTFVANHARNGGVLSAWTSEIKGADLVFDANSAGLRGGSLLCAEGCVMDIATSSFSNNSAGYGGVGYLDEGSSITIHDCQLSENAADNGGSFCANGATLRVFDSPFDKGQATMHGGFVRAVKGSRIILQNVNMVEGDAKNGGAISVDESELDATDCRIEQCSAQLDGGAMHLHNIRTSNCTRCQVVENRARRGGAVAVKYTESPSVELSFVRCALENNKASYGGAFHLLEPQKSEIQNARGQGRPLLGLVRTELSRNEATVGGHLILAFDLTGVRCICDDPFATTPPSIPSRDELEKADQFNTNSKICPEWQNVNRDDIATYVRIVEKTLVFQQTGERISVDGDHYTLSDHASGAPLPTIAFRALTQLGEPSSLGRSKDVISVKTKPGDFFSGSLQIDLHNGSGNFSSIVGFHHPGSYKLHIAFSEDYLPDFTVTVNIRDCRIGESVTAHGSFCRPCSGATYSFLPDRAHIGCLPCPENGNCSTSSIQPLPGYWHHWPCSDHLQKCLTEQACDFANREKRLYKLTKDLVSCTMPDGLIEAYGDAQCRTGHSGPLCGSCKPDYGKAEFFNCKECFAHGVNVTLYLLSILLFLLLAATAMKTNLQPGDEHPGSRKMLVAVFKIAVDFAQVTAITISINVPWSTTLSRFFQIAEFISGVIAQAIERAVYCLVRTDSDIDRAVFSVEMKCVTVAAVLLLCWAFWGIVTIVCQEDWRYFGKRVGMSFFVVVYLGYISLTSIAVHILTCLDVYDSQEVADDSTTAYWAADTNIRCHEGSHAKLERTLGWPLLVLSVLFPLFIACITLLLGRQGRNEGNRREILGFLYQSYKERYCFWESIVVVRKGAFAIIIVFSYPLGPNLQVMICAFVFTLALYLQTVCRPFGEDENGQDAADELHQLNDMESISLLLSLLTFVSSLCFNEEDVSSGVRLFVSLVILVLNLAFFSYLLCVFVQKSGIVPAIRHL